MQLQDFFLAIFVEVFFFWSNILTFHPDCYCYLRLVTSIWIWCKLQFTLYSTFKMSSSAKCMKSFKDDRRAFLFFRITFFRPPFQKWFDGIYDRISWKDMHHHNFSKKNFAIRDSMTTPPFLAPYKRCYRRNEFTQIFTSHNLRQSIIWWVKAFLHQSFFAAILNIAL